MPTATAASKTIAPKPVPVPNGDFTEFVLTYDGIPFYAVSNMEFREGRMATKRNISTDRLILNEWALHRSERSPNHFMVADRRFQPDFKQVDLT